MIIKGSYVNIKYIISAKLSKQKKETYLVITLDQKIIDGAGFGGVGYKNRIMHFIVENINEGNDIIRSINEEMDINGGSARR